jgi:hypothetical protein
MIMLEKHKIHFKCSLKNSKFCHNNRQFQTFINYTGYSDYSGYKMANTTIQISSEMKEKLASFGSKSETFETILQRIYSIAVKEQLKEFLMADGDYISIEEARKELDKKWPRLK